jgi:DNA-binding XRE family transcriptional regulator
VRVWPDATDDVHGLVFDFSELLPPGNTRSVNTVFMSSTKTVRSDRIRVPVFAHAFGVLLLQFIAKRLRDLRRKHGLTQDQMAALLKTDLRWYQRVEGGEKDIRATTVDRLGAVFGITAAQFLAPTIPDTRIATKILSAPHRPKRTAGAATKKGAVRG